MNKKIPTIYTHVGERRSHLFNCDIAELRTHQSHTLANYGYNTYNRQSIRIGLLRDMRVSSSYRIFMLHARISPYSTSANSVSHNITRMANLIMCGSYVKGGKKVGKRMLAHKLLSRSLQRANNPKYAHMFQFRNQHILSPVPCLDTPDVNPMYLFCKINSKSGFDFAEHNLHTSETAVLWKDVQVPCSTKDGFDDTASQTINVPARLISKAFNPYTQSSVVPRTTYTYKLTISQPGYACKTDDMCGARVAKPTDAGRDNRTDREVALLTAQVDDQLTTSVMCAEIFTPVSFAVEKTRFSSKQKYNQAVFHVLPSVEVRKVRIGGAPYQVPVAMNKRRQDGRALRSLIFFSAQRRVKRSRPLPYADPSSAPQKAASSTNSRITFIKNRKQDSQHAFDLHLSLELAGACHKLCQSVTQRDQMHSTAAINRGYVHYRWW